MEDKLISRYRGGGGMQARNKMASTKNSYHEDCKSILYGFKQFDPMGHSYNRKMCRKTLLEYSWLCVENVS